MADELFGSSEAGKKGGKARAAKLSAEERSAIASRAAEAKWEKAGRKPMPNATHEGELRIGDIVLACAVLDDGSRVISQASFLASLGIKKGGALAKAARDPEDRGAPLPLFVAHRNLRPFVDKGLTDVLRSPIRYRPRHAGRPGHGVKAETIPEVCEVWLRARDAKVLMPTQLRVAEQADMLIRGLARVGIIALIDEATGFQYDRPRRDLEKFLEKYLAESVRKWVRTFPADYFKHLCRLRGVELRPDMKLPQYFGTLTNNLIWRRIAPGLLRKLKERREERGRKSHKLWQWTSEDRGSREMLMHLGTVVGLMKIHTDYDAFEEQLDRIAPIYGDFPGLFDDPSDWANKED